MPNRRLPPCPSRERPACALLTAATVLLWCLPAQGQDLSGDQRARPGLYRVGAPQPGKTGRLALAGGLSGGVTEALSSGDAAHARVAGSAAVSLDASSFFNLGASVSGRYDRHARDEHGTDDGFLAEPELSARLTARLGRVGLGAELAGFVPGGPDFSTSLSGLSADGKLLLRAPLGAAVVAGYAGYRFDRTAEGAGKVRQLRSGDRSALGVSDFDAILLGIAGAYPIGEALLFGEVTAQALLDSPKLSASPTHVTLGVRQPIASRGLSAEVVLDTLVSARPDTPLGEPLFPIEPRATLRFGLSYRFGEGAPPARSGPAKSLPQRPEALVAPPAAPVVQSAKVELALFDERGQPLSHARVIITPAEPSPDPEPKPVGPLAEISPGLYRADALPAGRVRLHIEADGFHAIDRDLEVRPGEPVQLQVRAEVATPPGQVRGLVRSYGGKPLAATVRIEPGGIEATTDADGFFQLDVAPGQYEVVIEAPGYASQRRIAKVEQQGVVIVNADLARRTTRSGEASP